MTASVALVVRGQDATHVLAEQVRSKARARWATTRSDTDRLATAFDFFRAIAAAAGRGGLDTGPVTLRLIRVLWGAAEELADELAGEGGRG